MAIIAILSQRISMKNFLRVYREIFQTDLSEVHSTIWEKSPNVSRKDILLCCMAIIAILLQRISLKNSLRVCKHFSFMYNFLLYDGNRHYLVKVFIVRSLVSTFHVNRNCTRGISKRAPARGQQSWSASLPTTMPLSL